MAVSANRLELLQIADAVAREKTIDRKIVINAMEDAIQKAAKSRYGAETDVRAEIDPKTGETRLQRLLEVVEVPENLATQITLEDARLRHPAAQVGDTIADPLPPLEYGRIAAQSAKQVIMQKVREAERDRQYEDYKDRIGEIVNGTVKRVEYGNVIVDLGRGEAIIRRDELIPRESFRYGDRVRAYVYDVRREPRGPQIFMSRTHPQFMAKLFTMEVPEIYDGIITIKSVARDPGSRAKIAVVSRDSSIDPVGACVGMRGSRVQAVVGELQGERIDIIPWSPDAATFIVNSLQPAEVAKVVLDEEAERIEVVVGEDQLSLAIGRRGQNVRLASQLTGWDIDIMTEDEESERRQKEFAERTQLFVSALDVDEWSRSCLLPKASPTWRRSPSLTATNLLDRGLRRGNRRGIADPRPRASGADRGGAGRGAPQAWRLRRPEGRAGPHCSDAARARQERHQVSRGPGLFGHRRPRRLVGTQGWRNDPL
jgi:N utilization substance protein A